MPSASTPRLRSELDKTLHEWTTVRPRASVLVSCLDDTEASPVLAFDEETALPPGSTVKLVLTAGALVLLPAGFRDPTLAALADVKLLAAKTRTRYRTLVRNRGRGRTNGARSIQASRRHAAAEVHRRVASLSLRIGGPQRFGHGLAGYLRGPLSPRLAALLRRMNVESDNLVAEGLAADIGAVTAGTADASVGIARVETILKERGLLGPADTLADPSGISAANRLSAASLVRVLVDMNRDGWGERLRRSLPAPGEGTLRGRFTAGEGSVANLRAKTGHLPGVASLAGYVTSYTGRRYAFAFLMCDADVRGAERTQDLIVSLLAAGAADPEEAGRPL